MRAIDERHLTYPFLEARRFAQMLERKGFDVSCRHVGHSYASHGIKAISRRRRTIIPAEGQVYLYLLRGKEHTLVPDVREKQPGWCV